MKVLTIIACLYGGPQCKPFVIEVPACPEIPATQFFRWKIEHPDYRLKHVTCGMIDWQA